MPGVKGLCGQWAGGREWSAVDKGMLPVVLLIPVFVSYLGWVDYAQGRPDRDLLIDVAAAQSLRTALWAMLAGALALTALGLLLRRYRPALMLFQYLGTGFYAATMAYCGYVVGSLSFAAGIVALGAPWPASSCSSAGRCCSAWPSPSPSCCWRVTPARRAVFPTRR